MTFYDREFKCHTFDDGTMTPFETDFFDCKCDTFIEGYRYVPADETWVREDGVEFRGEMVAPWKPYGELAAAQAQYEADTAALTEAYQEGVNSV